MLAHRLVGVAADDEQPGRPPAHPQPRDRVEQGVEPLDRRDAADPEQHRPLVERESGARLGPIARHEQVGVDAARDRRDPRGGGAVVAQQLGALHHVGGHDPVAVTHDPGLLVQPNRGLLLGGRSSHPVLQPAQRVEHLHDRHRPARLQPERGDAGEPVVGVDQVVVDRSRDPPRVDPVDELVQVAVNPHAGHRRLVAGRQVDDTGALAERHHARNRRVLRAREDVDRYAHAAELARDLPDVHVHTARFLAAQRGQRARVHAQHRDVQVHRILTW